MKLLGDCCADLNDASEIKEIGWARHSGRQTRICFSQITSDRPERPPKDLLCTAKTEVPRVSSVDVATATSTP
ncbi:hypothetical protein L917_08183 [Phytophthora nicotianae]|uniref:Uncharacterized protein n=1 Tax=Phytophthora nicotianae TaxID=4792 RepID=W2L8R0_PHYNI|nr:hypothetical protein L917_08183 [Phytophthora nicotianae]